MRLAGESDSPRLFFERHQNKESIILKGFSNTSNNGPNDASATISRISNFMSMRATIDTDNVIDLFQDTTPIIPSRNKEDCQITCTLTGNDNKEEDVRLKLTVVDVSILLTHLSLLNQSNQEQKIQIDQSCLEQMQQHTSEKDRRSQSLLSFLLKADFSTPTNQETRACYLGNELEPIAVTMDNNPAPATKYMRDNFRTVYKNDGSIFGYIGRQPFHQQHASETARDATQKIMSHILALEHPNLPKLIGVLDKPFTDLDTHGKIYTISQSFVMSPLEDGFLTLTTWREEETTVINRLSVAIQFGQLIQHLHAHQLYLEIEGYDFFPPFKNLFPNPLGNMFITQNKTGSPHLLVYGLGLVPELSSDGQSAARCANHPTSILFHPIEVFKNRDETKSPSHSTEADAFRFALFICIVLTDHGRPYGRHSSPEEIMQKKLASTPPFNLEQFEVSASCKDILQQCFSKTPQERPPIDKIMSALLSERTERM